MSDELANIDVAKIKQNPSALRPVNKQSVEYEGLVASVREMGILNAVSIKANEDEDSEQYPYVLIDGLHRWTAAIDAGLMTIPSLIKSLDDCQVLQAQLIANVHKIETKPVQYSKQLQRILAYMPTMTQNELAGQLGKSGQWLRERLGLQKLSEKIGDLVDKGELQLANAYVLAKLPEDEQVNFLEQALTMQPGEFGPVVKNRITEIKKAAREGREPGTAEFVPGAFLQKVGDIKSELESSDIGKALLAKHGINNPQAAWNLAIKWALHLDPDSVAVQKEKDEERKSREKEKREGRAAERSVKKAKTAQERANTLKKEAEEEKSKLKAASK